MEGSLELEVENKKVLRQFKEVNYNYMVRAVRKG